MKMYQEFAKYLTQLLGGDTAVRITVSGYLSLSVEDIGTREEEHGWCHSVTIVSRMAT